MALVTVNLNPDIFEPHPISISFELRGSNFRLEVEKGVAQHFTLMIFGAVVSGLTFLIFLVSLTTDRFIGLQLVFTAEIMFFGSVLSAYSGADLVAYSSLRYADGFNDIIVDYEKIYNQKTAFRSMDFYTETLLNFNVMFFLLVASLLVLLGLKVFKKYRGMQLAENKESRKFKTLYEESNGKLNSFTTNVFKPLFLISLMRIITCISINLNFENSSKSY